MCVCVENQRQPFLRATFCMQFRDYFLCSIETVSHIFVEQLEKLDETVSQSVFQMNDNADTPVQLSRRDVEFK